MKFKGTILSFAFALVLATLTSCDVVLNNHNNDSNNLESLNSFETPKLTETLPSLSKDISYNSSSESTKIIDYELVFADEFNNNSLDQNIWNVEYGTGAQYGLWGWGNGELEYYQEQNIMVNDGTLKITARREHVDSNNFTSGRINTKDKIYFKYGYFEAKMKLPMGNGMWPAFWMLPNNSPYGGWPTSGEIDIMEAKGSAPYHIDTTLHFGSNNNHQYKGTTSNIPPDNQRMDDFHLYGLEWTSDYIAWFINRQMVFKLNNYSYWSGATSEQGAPFNQEFYFLFNLAIGGQYDNFRQPDDTFQSATMEVDYLRVYQEK